MENLGLVNRLSKTKSLGTLKQVFKKLEESVIEKKADLKIRNANIVRPPEYPLFDRPELVKPVGFEVTKLVRQNFDRLILEAGKYSAIEKLSGHDLGLPKRQIDELRNVVFSNRIFTAVDVDHERGRIEFDLNKNDIIERWENTYHEKWPVYKNNIIADGKILAKQDKKVSRHHFLPVGTVLVKENSQLANMIDEGKIKMTDPRLSSHYAVNEHYNMIPSIHPKEHVNGLHNDNSVFSSVFYPILKEYHYNQIDPADDSRFVNAVPAKYHKITLPSFAKQFEFYLEKYEDKLGYQFPERQKSEVAKFVNDFVRAYPDGEKVVDAETGRITVKPPMLREIDQGDVTRNIRKITKLANNVLKSEWEDNTGMQWPARARVEFLIPPFFEAQRYEWWMIAPGEKPAKASVAMNSQGQMSRDSERYHAGRPSRDLSGYNRKVG